MIYRCDAGYNWTTLRETAWNNHMDEAPNGQRTVDFLLCYNIRTLCFTRDFSPYRAPRVLSAPPANAQVRRQAGNWIRQNAIYPLCNLPNTWSGCPVIWELLAFQAGTGFETTPLTCAGNKSLLYAQSTRPLPHDAMSQKGPPPLRPGQFEVPLRLLTAITFMLSTYRQNLGDLTGWFGAPVDFIYKCGSFRRCPSPNSTQTSTRLEPNGKLPANPAHGTPLTDSTLKLMTRVLLEVKLFLPLLQG